jgi:hypothetical protein
VEDWVLLVEEALHGKRAVWLGHNLAGLFTLISNPIDQETIGSDDGPMVEAINESNDGSGRRRESKQEYQDKG